MGSFGEEVRNFLLRVMGGEVDNNRDGTQLLTQVEWEEIKAIPSSRIQRGIQ